MSTRVEFKRLYVRPHYRGHRLGQGVLDWVIAKARTLGYRESLPTRCRRWRRAGDVRSRGVRAHGSLWRTSYDGGGVSELEIGLALPSVRVFEKKGLVRGREGQKEHARFVRERAKSIATVEGNRLIVLGVQMRIGRKRPRNPAWSDARRSSASTRRDRAVGTAGRRPCGRFGPRGWSDSAGVAWFHQAQDR